MKISKLKLKSFRNYKDEIEIPISELTTFVGKNDSGKSTILEALDLFFNEKNACIKLEPEDLNKDSLGADDNNIEISVVFTDLPSSIDLDAGNKTTLADEYLLNSDSELEIKKVSDSGKAFSVFIVANHPSSNLSKNLMELKQTELKKIITDNGIGCGNKTVNAIMRKAIREHEDNLGLQTQQIDIKKEDAKKIWDNLQKYMPIFTLFQADRSNSDQDNEVQDPMKLAVKEILQEEGLQNQLNAIFETVKNGVKEIAENTLSKLNGLNPEIASELKPKLPSADTLKWPDVFKSIGITSDNNISLNKRGSGVRRLVLLSFFCAEADRRRKKDNLSDIIYAIEEPETSQHPDHQKILMDSLLGLSQADNTQILLTTHSPALAQLVPLDSLRLVNNNSVDFGTDDIYRKIVKTLGVLPNYGKLIVCVEGKNDVNFLMNINACIPELKTIIDLSTGDIPLMPLHGSNLKSWVDKDYLRNSNVIQFHLYDKDDDNKYQTEVDTINSRDDGSIAVLTDRREIENYIPKDIIETKLNIVLDESVNFETDNIPLLASQRTGKSEETVKQILNGTATKDITKEQLESMGVWDEVSGWFMKIKNINDGLREIEGAE